MRRLFGGKGQAMVPWEDPAGEDAMDDADDWLPPRGTVAGRLARWPDRTDSEAAELAFLLTPRAPVPAERFVLSERLAKALGVDRDALVREVCGVDVGPTP